MKNGSGLNDANRFSARQTVTLLREMWRRFPCRVRDVLMVAAGTDDRSVDGTARTGHLRRGAART
jgi:D-alanyl-D-alanine carboxypeptidase/D-alanyl-D-alanine-endopeptidase (penicillin-binding protein 4)